MKRLLPSEYERTCEDCGYMWRLNRQLAKFQARGRIPLLARGRSHRPARIASSARRQGSLIAEINRCAKCGGKRFTQKPLPDA
jgi:hypothetical protein